MLLRKTFILMTLFTFGIGFGWTQEIRTPFTNQFFVGSASDGAKYYVFTYDRDMTLVKTVNGRPPIKVKLIYPNLNNVVSITIVNNEMIVYQMKSLSIYDLARMVVSDNNNKDIDDLGKYRLSRTNDVVSISDFDNKFFFIKMNDNAVYEYQGAGRSVAVNNMIINNSDSENKYFLFHPFYENWQADYNKSKADTSTMISFYTKYAEPNFGGIEVDKLIAGFTEQNRNISNIYNSVVTSLFQGRYNRDKEAISNFLSVAGLLGYADAAANDLIRPLTMRIPDEKTVAASVRTYFDSIDEVVRLNSPGEKTRREAETNREYERQENALIVAMTSNFGQDYEEKHKVYAKFYNEIHRRYTWEPGNRATHQAILQELNSNKGKINSYHNDLAKLLSFKANDDYNALKDFYLKFVELYDRNTPAINDEVIKGILELGKNISAMQKTFFDDCVNGSVNMANSRKKITFEIFNMEKINLDSELKRLKDERTRKLQDVAASIEREKQQANQKKQEKSRNISAYMIGKFCGDIKNDIETAKAGVVAKLASSGYDQKLLNFSIVSNRDKIVFGYKIKDTFDFGTFTGIQTSYSDNQRSMFSNMLKNKNLFMLMVNKNQLKIYDMNSKNLMASEKIFQVPKNIAYIIKSENYMYYVEESGDLYRIGYNRGIGSAEKTGIQVKMADGRDFIFIASNQNGTDTVSVLSASGAIRGDRNNGRIMIASRNNGTDISVLNLRDNNWIIGSN